VKEKITINERDVNNNNDITTKVHVHCFK